MKIEWRLVNVDKCIDRLVAVLPMHPWDFTNEGYIQQDYDGETGQVAFFVYFHNQQFQVDDLMEGIDKLTWLIESNHAFKGE